MSTGRSPRFNYDGIRFELGHPDNFTDAELLAMQGVAIQSFTKAASNNPIGLPNEVIRGNLLHYDDTGDYWIANHRDPQVAVVKGDLNEAEFSDPLIVVAMQEGTNQTVGFVTSWLTASGKTPDKRERKMNWPPQLFFVPPYGDKCYAWQRDLGVLPGFDHLGLGHGLIYFSTRERHRWRKVSGYIVDGVTAGLTDYAENAVGMKNTGHGRTPKADTEPLLYTTTRFTIRANRLAGFILRQDGAKEAIQTAEVIRRPSIQPDPIGERGLLEGGQFPDGHGNPRPW